MQEMGFLVDGRSVIGVSNSVVQPPITRMRTCPSRSFANEDGMEGAERINVVEESWRMRGEKDGKHGDGKITSWR